MYKFTGFTEKANIALNAAIEVAQNMGHTYIGSEHLLAGLLEEDSGIAYRVAEFMSDWDLPGRGSRRIVEHPGSKIIGVQLDSPRVPADVTDSQLVGRDFPYGDIPVLVGSDPPDIKVNGNSARLETPGETGGPRDIETGPVTPSRPDIAVGPVMEITFFLESPIT